MYDFLKEWIVDKAVFADFAATDKASAILAMVRVLLEGRGFPPAEVDGMARQIIRRESLGSTGIGQGLAFPHAKVAGVGEIHLGWFRAAAPVEFDALDEQPCRLFACWLCPATQAGHHLRTAEQVSRLLRDPECRARFEAGVDHLRDYLQTETRLWSRS